MKNTSLPPSFDTAMRNFVVLKENLVSTSSLGFRSITLSQLQPALTFLIHDTNEVDVLLTLDCGDVTEQRGNTCRNNMSRTRAKPLSAVMKNESGF